MSFAQQALYRMCSVVPLDRVRAAHAALSGSGRRDLPHLTTRAVLAIYLENHK